MQDGTAFDNSVRTASVTVVSLQRCKMSYWLMPLILEKLDCPLAAAHISAGALAVGPSAPELPPAALNGHHKRRKEKKKKKNTNPAGLGVHLCALLPQIHVPRLLKVSGTLVHDCRKHSNPTTWPHREHGIRGPRV